MYQEKKLQFTEKGKDAYKKLPKLKTCFYRCKLKTGTLIIALLYIFSSSFAIIQVIVRHLIYIHRSEKDVKNEKNEKIKPESVESAELVLTIIISLIELITASLMLYGSLNRHHKFMLPFMVMETISFVCFFVGAWVLIIMSFIHSFGLGLLYLLLFHGLLALMIYCNLVVHSRYDQLKLKNLAIQNVLY